MFPPLLIVICMCRCCSYAALWLACSACLYYDWRALSIGCSVKYGQAHMKQKNEISVAMALGVVLRLGLCWYTNTTGIAQPLSEISNAQLCGCQHFGDSFLRLVSPLVLKNDYFLLPLRTSQSIRQPAVQSLVPYYFRNSHLS